MRMYDIIAKKRDGGALSNAEIAWFVAGTTAGEIPDYQAAALLMAICIRGMAPAETATLTDCMARSGGMVDLSAIPGLKADKHSTGGVGDKTTLVVAPLVAACGVPVAKMSGRGLGFTGGTADKLEAIPGLRLELPLEDFLAQVREIGLALVTQSGNLAPADKKLYALRDVTATTDSLPLIASSIMSKKLAAGSDVILLDVKTGSGAFMKTLEDSIALAQAMVEIGEANGRRTAALVTDMGTPLGVAIGNSVEVAEAVETLRGRGPADLTEVCLALAAGMLRLAGKGTGAQCCEVARQALQTGAGYEKLRQMVAAQGGDVAVLDDPGRFPAAKMSRPVAAPRGGYIAAMDTAGIGAASVMLGAGREAKGDAIDPAAGLLLHAKTGARVEAGEAIATLLAASEERLDRAEQAYLAAVAITDERPAPVKLLQAEVDADGVRLL